MIGRENGGRSVGFPNSSSRRPLNPGANNARLKVLRVVSGRFSIAFERIASCCSSRISPSFLAEKPIEAARFISLVPALLVMITTVFLKSTVRP